MTEAEATDAGLTGVREIKHNFPSEYEVGPTGNRHKIKYFTREELKDAIEWLKEQGFLDPAI